MRIGLSWIDLKLALRMLLRYPGLTLVGALGMAVAICVSVTAFTISWKLLDPVVPLEEGDRVVGILNWDARTNNRELRSLHDYLAWKEELRSVEDIGAFRDVSRNLIVAGAQPEAVNLAEMSASGFRLARVAPLLGRHLLPEDEQPAAADVVVIREDVWWRRFGSDPRVLGQTIQLGRTAHTIVGVMPESFAFPVNHSYWIPLRLPSAMAPRQGPTINVFARLAPGATLESAAAELTAIGQRTSAALPATHEHLRARIIPYTHAQTDMDDPDNALALHAIQVMILLLLVLVSVNVSILVYARTASRQGEIAVRTALGASRWRIVTQLFTEALVLAGAAALLAILLVSAGLTQLDAAIASLPFSLPFWLEFRLSASAIVYIAALTVCAAAIVGVAPAVKATGRQVQARLQGLSAGSGSRMQMGKLWTALIVVQVAVAVAILPATIYHAYNALLFRAGDLGYAADEFLTTELVMDRPSLIVSTEQSEQEFRARYAARQQDLERRLEEQSAVSHVTFSIAPPGGELAGVIEIEGMAPPVDPVDYNIVEGTKQGHFVRFNRIAVDYFDAYDVSVLMGRGLTSADAAPGANRILVSRSFADMFAGGANVLGRRVRYVGRSREAGQRNMVLDRWYEIVGVVPDFPPDIVSNPERAPRIYHPVAPQDLYPALMAVRVRGTEPSAFSERVREISAAVDPSLQLQGLSSADDVARQEQDLFRLIGVTLTAVTVSVVALAAAGIYALMSFTVARRRREIGIRAALGADPARILAGIFSRVFAQLAIGAVLGIIGAIGLEALLEGEMFQGKGAIVLPLVAVCTTVVGLLAAWGPAREGLRIQPTEALREE
jgi:putative ABC transport system permease protein